MTVPVPSGTAVPVSMYDLHRNMQKYVIHLYGDSARCVLANTPRALLVLTTPLARAHPHPAAYVLCAGLGGAGSPPRRTGALLEVAPDKTPEITIEQLSRAFRLIRMTVPCMRAVRMQYRHAE